MGARVAQKRKRQNNLNDSLSTTELNAASPIEINAASQISPVVNFNEHNHQLTSNHDALLFRSPRRDFNEVTSTPSAARVIRQAIDCVAWPVTRPVRLEANSSSFGPTNTTLETSDVAANDSFTVQLNNLLRWAKRFDGRLRRIEDTINTLNRSLTVRAYVEEQSGMQYDANNVHEENHSTQNDHAAVEVAAVRENDSTNANVQYLNHSDLEAARKLSNTRTEFVSKLCPLLFSMEERISCNCNGYKKPPLPANKLNYIKKQAFMPGTKFALRVVDDECELIEWKKCINAIDNSSRTVRYTYKRKQSK